MCNIFEGIEETIQRVENFWASLIPSRPDGINQIISHDTIECVRGNHYEFSRRIGFSRLTQITNDNNVIMMNLTPLQTGISTKSGVHTDQIPNINETNQKREEIKEKRVAEAKRLLEQHFQETEGKP